MRVLLHAVLDSENTNEAMHSGSFNGVIDQVLSHTKAETAYFTIDPATGDRCAHIVFDLKNTQDLPQITEPLFRTCGARITMTPVMDQSEMIDGLQAVRGTW